MRLGKYESPRVKKTWKVVTVVTSVFALLTCVALATFGVLYLAGVYDLTNDSARVYTVRFYDEETNDVFFYESFVRGAKLTYKFKPSKDGFKFRGWDLNNDSFIDIVPSRVYKNINAKALWMPEVKKNAIS